MATLALAGDRSRLVSDAAFFTAIRNQVHADSAELERSIDELCSIIGLEQRV
jgi:hypothetical protein